MRQWVGALLLLAVVPVAAPGLAQPVPLSLSKEPVDWRVKDRFRLFDRADQRARQKIGTLLETIAANPKSTGLHHFHEDFLVALTGKDGARVEGESLRASNYIATDSRPDRGMGRYAADYLFPADYAIEAKLTEPQFIGKRCLFSTAIQSVEGPCDKHTAVRIASGRAVAASNWEVRSPLRITPAGAAPLVVDIRFRDDLVVALGDSFISGEGNPDVPSLISDVPDEIFERPSWGSKAVMGKHVLRAAQWWDEPCHRSLLSWPVLATLAEAAHDPKRAISLVHLGCSGAIAKDIYRSGETELPGGGNERLSQLELLDLAMRLPDDGWTARKVSRVYLSVGGNDIGFARVLATLAIPPNGYTLGAGFARMVGKKIAAVCPYTETGKPLSRLCDTQVSAQERLGELAHEYAKLDEALTVRGIAPDTVFQPTYPNPLLQGDAAPCDTNPGNDGKDVPKQGGVASGFETLMGTVDRIARGPLRKSWGFELQYYADDTIDDWTLPDGPKFGAIYPASEVRCDWKPEVRDSEVCQAIWVHAVLNDKVAANSNRKWRIVDSHLPRLNAQGLCGSNAAFPRATVEVAKQPKGRRLVWTGGRTPQNYQPYAADSPRWFRLPNDSILTQFGYFDGNPRFHHGTAHPTFSAHLEYAAAIAKAVETARPSTK